MAVPEHEPPVVERRLPELLAAGIEVVLAVRGAIPALGALPGDEIVVRPSDQDFPVCVLRTFGMEVVSLIPRASVTLLSAEPVDDAPACAAPGETHPQPVPTPLQLVS